MRERMGRWGPLAFVALFWIITIAIGIATSRSNP
jgi:hypothetical protein